MIWITKGQANDVTVTLTEKGTASHYLFRFQNRMTFADSYCVEQDTSPYTDRYNQFSITETASPTATDGEVELDAGQYKYWVYANSSSSNLDPDGLDVLETGMCTVVGTVTTFTEYDNNPNWVEYNG